MSAIAFDVLLLVACASAVALGVASGAPIFVLAGVVFGMAGAVWFCIDAWHWLADQNERRRWRSHFEDTRPFV